MELWLIVFILAIVCAGIGVVARPKREEDQQVSLSGALQTGNEMSSPYPMVPSHWDETAVTAQLTQLRQHRPSLVPHFVDSIKERFIVGQDNRTAQARLRFM